MRKFESIYDFEKFGKTELKKIKGGLKKLATGTLRDTSAPLRVNENMETLTQDSDSD